MYTVYVYLLDTLADWELGHVMAELNSARYFKKGAMPISIQTVTHGDQPIQSMGGVTMVPNCSLNDMIAQQTSTLLLPGADSWDQPKHGAILQKAEEFLATGATVGAICGATAALANWGLLDKRPHTSNGLGYLEMVAPGYKGQDFYIDKPSVADNNLITASSTGSLLWDKQIIAHLGVFNANTLDCWYDYFRTGDAAHFFALMNTLASGDKNSGL